ncbi:MAG TPA: hypothetical protein VH500_00115 [Nitrososphaeraceae archaeon]
MLITPLKPPTIEEVKKLSTIDIAIMNALSYSFRAKIRQLVQIDPYTVSDPFGEADDYEYSVIVDTEIPARIVMMNVSIKDISPEIPWKDLLNNQLSMIQLSKPDALQLKNELMPKDTNNFYRYRRSGKIVGYFMFAFQICGHK